MIDDETPWHHVVFLTWGFFALGLLALLSVSWTFPAGTPDTYLFSGIFLVLGLDALNTFRKRYPIFRKRLRERRALASKA